MNASIIVAGISAAASIFVAAVSYYLTKKKERDADWRKYKFEQYKDFMISISGIVGSDITAEGQRYFARTSNTLHLLAPKKVLSALHTLQDEIRSSNPNPTPGRADELLSHLIWEIRCDLQIADTPDHDEVFVRLWSSGTKENQFKKKVR